MYISLVRLDVKISIFSNETLVENDKIIKNLESSLGDVQNSSTPDLHNE